MNKGIYLLIALVLLLGCSNPKSKKSTESTIQPIKPVHLNISFLLDLSDRISPTLNPKQAERDKKTIFAVVNFFKKYISQKKAILLKDKIKVTFHPIPESNSISKIAGTLRFNFGGENVNKKKLYNRIVPTYKKYITNIYALATKRKRYLGSDIWHFMKNKVRDNCIIKKKNYRNILVILTDGYLYWPYDQRKRKNRFNYITPSYKHFYQFRNTKLLRTKFDQQDYGFIPVQDSLSSLEILVVGIDPPKQYPQDYAIIKKYWSKWFEEMNVKRYKIIQTGLSSNTNMLVKNFLSSR